MRILPPESTSVHTFQSHSMYFRSKAIHQLHVEAKVQNTQVMFLGRN